MGLARKTVALTIGIVAFMSSEAQAADYLIYSFKFKGTESRISNALPGNGNLVPGYGNAAAEEGSIVYYLPMSFAGSASYFTNVSPSFMAPDMISGTANGNLFTLNESLTGPYRAPTRNVSISACFAGGIPGASFVILPSCSSLSFRDAVSMGTAGSDLRTITGTLTGLTVTEGFGSAKFGLASYPLIPVQAAATPEPAAWALMIFGMSAIGYAMRRRKGPSLNPKAA